MFLTNVLQNDINIEVRDSVRFDPWFDICRCFNLSPGHPVALSAAVSLWWWGAVGATVVRDLADTQ